jgi:hypothetical protein
VVEEKGGDAKEKDAKENDAKEKIEGDREVKNGSIRRFVADKAKIL